MGDEKPQIPASAVCGDEGSCNMAASGDYVAVGDFTLVVYAWTSSQWVQVHLRQCAPEY